jgi:hypothetical protein
VVIANNLGDKKKGEQQEGGTIEKPTIKVEQDLGDDPPFERRVHPLAIHQAITRRTTVCEQLQFTTQFTR